MGFSISVLVVVALSVASCACAPIQEGRAANDTAPEIAAEVQQCGLNIDNVTFVTTTTEQYLTFERHPALSDTEFECLAKALVTGEYGLRTRDEAFSRRYGRAWKNQHALHVRKLANEWIAANMASIVVPEFSGVEGNLADFVAEVERICDAPQGTASVTGPSHVYLPWPQEPANEANCLFTVLRASNLHEHGIDVGWGGVP